MSIILPIARVEQELSRSGREMCPERVERDESADQGGRRSQPLDSCDAEVVDEGRDAEDGKGCLFHDDQWQSQNMTGPARGSVKLGDPYAWLSAVVLQHAE